jgi:hypothetical protein
MGVACDRLRGLPACASTGKTLSLAVSTKDNIADSFDDLLFALDIEVCCVCLGFQHLMVLTTFFQEDEQQRSPPEGVQQCQSTDEQECAVLVPDVSPQTDLLKEVSDDP